MIMKQANDRPLQSLISLSRTHSKNVCRRDENALTNRITQIELRDLGNHIELYRSNCIQRGELMGMICECAYLFVRLGQLKAHTGNGCLKHDLINQSSEYKQALQTRF